MPTPNSNPFCTHLAPRSRSEPPQSFGPIDPKASSCLGKHSRHVRLFGPSVWACRPQSVQQEKVSLFSFPGHIWSGYGPNLNTCQAPTGGLEGPGAESIGVKERSETMSRCLVCLVDFVFGCFVCVESMVCLLACLPACLPACMLACMPFSPHREHSARCVLFESVAPRGSGSNFLSSALFCCQPFRGTLGAEARRARGIPSRSAGARGLGPLLFENRR